MGVGVRPVNITDQINTLVRRINQGMCILFIGPGLLRTTDGTPLNNAFALSLARELETENIEFDENQKENMAYLIQHYILAMNEKKGNNSLKIIDLRTKYIEFVKGAELDMSLYNRLARIPFCLVINANYDDQFHSLFELNFPGKRIQFDYYDFSNQSSGPKEKKILPPGLNNFVVYNLFGLCADQSINSMILTEKEFVRFVSRINQPNTNLPVELTNHIDQNKYCLFLGFDFDQWYLKVVIRALWNAGQTDSENEKEKPDTLALSLPPYPTAFFYQDAYKFYFINHNLDTFLNTLIEVMGPVPKPIPIPPKDPLVIFFISDINSKEDNNYRKQISSHLRYLIEIGYASLRSEDMAIGNVAGIKIAENIREAKIVVALVSVGFLNEGKFELIERVRAENNNPGLIKLAVLLRPCVEKFQDDFTEFTWIPEHRDKINPIKALNQFSVNEQEGRISLIAEKIMQYVFDIVKK